jgi:hypothetical protein
MWQGLIHGVISMISACMECGFSFTLQLFLLHGKSLEYTVDGMFLVSVVVRKKVPVGVGICTLVI